MSGNRQQDRYLSDNLRDKYIGELVAHKKTWFLEFKSSLGSQAKKRLGFGAHFWGVACVLLVLMYAFIFFEGGFKDLYKEAVWDDMAWALFTTLLLASFFGFNYMEVMFAKLFGISDELQEYTDRINKHNDDMLEHLYNEILEIRRDNELKNKYESLAGKIIVTIIIVGFGSTVFMIGTSSEDNIVKTVWRNITSSSVCSIESYKVVEDSFMVAGEPDYGFSIFVNLKNTGNDGNVFIKLELTSSEGNWDRKQTVYLKAGEDRRLTYQFQEPTISATNVRYNISCTPTHPE